MSPCWGWTEMRNGWTDSDQALAILYVRGEDVEQHKECVPAYSYEELMDSYVYIDHENRDLRRENRRLRKQLEPTEPPPTDGAVILSVIATAALFVGIVVTLWRMAR